MKDYTSQGSSITVENIMAQECHISPVSPMCSGSAEQLSVASFSDKQSKKRKKGDEETGLAQLQAIQDKIFNILDDTNTESSNIMPSLLYINDSLKKFSTEIAEECEEQLLEVVRKVVILF